MLHGGMSSIVSCDLSGSIREFERYIEVMNEFVRDCEGAFVLHAHELDAWDLPEEGARRQCREQIVSDIQKKMVLEGLAKAILTDSRRKIVCIFIVTKQGDYQFQELEGPFRLEIGGDDGEAEEPCEKAQPYSRQSSSPAAYILHPDGSQTSLCQDAVCEPPNVDNYLLTDDVCIYWDNDGQTAMNVPAMSLIRDAEAIHFNNGELDDRSYYPIEVFGNAVVVEGIVN